MVLLYLVGIVFRSVLRAPVGVVQEPFSWPFSNISILQCIQNEAGFQLPSDEAPLIKAAASSSLLDEPGLF